MEEKKRNKRASRGKKTLLAISAALLALGAAVYFYISAKSVPEAEKAAVASSKAAESEGYFSMDKEWEDEDFCEALHRMSHQKVASDLKWGAIKLTPQRVSELQDLLQIHEKQLKHASVYKEILARWENEDFSKAVEDHNMIWSLQEGTVGKAERLLTDEEEQEYIERENLQ